MATSNTPKPTTSPTPAPRQAPAPAPALARMPHDEHTGKAGRFVRDKATGERRPA